MSIESNNIPNKQYVYNALLRCNYLPMVKSYLDEIPPTFSTADLTPEIADHIVENCSGRREGYDQIEYRTTRHTNVSRFHQIPHPLPYTQLCKCIVDHWDRIKYISGNKVSKIKPEIRDDARLIIQGEYDSPNLNRVVVMKNKEFPDDVIEKLDGSIGCKYFVEADISSCYQTIYTHSIPWALVGHETAKKNQSKSHKWYNKLDKRQRYLKKNETQGIPIGPATSNIITELILYRIDEELTSDNFRYTRFIDDYMCYCKDEEEAERFLVKLEDELRKYLLNLNAGKVKIEKLPIPNNDTWVMDLKDNLSDEEKPNEQFIANYLDNAINLQHLNPNGSVLKYASRTLVNKVHENNVDIYLKYLTTMSFHYPVLLPILSEVANRYCYEIKAQDLKPVIEKQMELKRSDAICWCLYIMARCDMKIGNRLAEAIIRTKDCMSITMLAATGQHINKVKDFIYELDKNYKYDLDRYWILIYEYANDNCFDQYFEESGFNCLRDNQVSFIKNDDLIY